MFSRSLYVRKHGFHKYSGDDVKIAKQVIGSCWDKEKSYFRVSSGHFNEFYCRDFGMCAESLVKLGYRKRVIQTLDYALSCFRKHGRITTSISAKGVCFDFPCYGADSLPFIIHALRISKAKGLIKEYGPFLRGETDHYFREVFDNRSSLVRAGKHFSSMKDYARRSSSCYSNCMLAMLSDDLSALRVYNPFSDYDVKKSILHHFWNGRYFYDDLSRQRVVTGDANTFPFWCGVVDSKSIFGMCMEAMEKEGLTSPFPLKYTSRPGKIHRMHFLEFFAGDYERDSIWMHLGLCFLDVVKRYDKKRFSIYMKQYWSLMKEHRNFLEVYGKDGKPFSNFFYYSDESMVWVSKWLCLKKY